MKPAKPLSELRMYTIWFLLACPQSLIYGGWQGQAMQGSSHPEGFRWLNNLMPLNAVYQCKDLKTAV
jgi:hypothetical protein